MATKTSALTVAVTGPTGTFGFGLLPLLEAHPGIGRIIGVARRPFDPAAHGWSKMTYRQGDVRDEKSLADVFAGADVVVHLAFLITGSADRDTIEAVNVDGTLNAFRAAAAAGAKRFVYASSAAAYGFHADNPLGMTEEWPVRPDRHFFYAAEKADLEALLATEAAATGGTDLYLLRPPIVLGPHALGAKHLVPSLLRPLLRGAARIVRNLPAGVPVLLPAIPMQFVHEADVGHALLQCVLGAGPPGAYNIAGAGTVTAHDVAHELGLRPIPLPVGATQRTARAVARIPRPSFVPPVLEWVEALAQPVVVDTDKARRELGWRPRYSGIEALRATIGAAPAEGPEPAGGPKG